MHAQCPLILWCNFWVMCRCIHEKSIAEDKEVLFDEGQKLTLQNIMEQRLSISTLRKTEYISKNIETCDGRFPCDCILMLNEFYGRKNRFEFL